MRKAGTKLGPKTVRTPTRRTPPRSFTCPPELWEQVVAYARAHRIPSSAAVRVLLSTGLESQRLARARAWQIEQGWQVVEAMERGDVKAVGWDAIRASYEEGRRKLTSPREAR